MINPALAALVCVTPYVSSTRTAAWLSPSNPPILSSRRLTLRTKSKSAIAEIP